MMMNDPILEALCQRVGWTLIHFVWQGLSAALILVVALAILKQASARIRYAVCCLALIAMVVLPVVTFCVLEASPKERLPLTAIPASVAMAPSGQALPIPALEAIERDTEFLPSVSIQRVVIPRESRLGMMLERSLPYVSLFWLIGVMTLCVWHVGGWIQLQRFKRTVTQDIDTSILTIFDRLVRQMCIGRAVSLYESSKVYVPTVIGWIKPVVLLPVSAMSGLSTEQIESIVAHELAHIQRQDFLVNILQTLVETLGFYHPAVWWVSRQIRIEREHCCDDLAVEVCGDSMAYARALTQLETIRPKNGILAMTATGGSLTHRIKRLVLTPATSPSTPAWVSGLVFTLILAAIICPMAVAWGHSRSIENELASGIPAVDANIEFPPTNSKIEPYHVESNAHSDSPVTEGRIYEISDLAGVKAGLKMPPLDRNALISLRKKEIELEGRIKAAIASESWDYSKGGKGRVLSLGLGKLFVLQTKVIHGEIELYLEAMRERQRTIGTSEPSSESSVPTEIRLETRIYDISDLVTKLAGSKEQSLETNFFTQKLLDTIEPQSWYLGGGEGTCTVFGGIKLAVLQTRAIHEKIGLYLEAIRQYGGFQDESLLPDGWALEFKVWDQEPEPNEVSSLEIMDLKGESRLNESCRLRFTTFSGERIFSMSSEESGPKQLSVPIAKYLVFYSCGWGKHPDNVGMRSGPFLLNLCRPGQYRLTPTARLGSGQIAGTHKGCYAVNFESTERFPVITGFAYQSPPGEYRIEGLASGHYLLNAVTQHSGDNVFVRRARVRVASGK
ncbi:MAG: M56 family metallopeptidase, partial [Phycisphaerae bacterium]|nr:M56 family metallopeptidase [Phycisphaerae bacterium]